MSDGMAIIRKAANAAKRTVPMISVPKVEIVTMAVNSTPCWVVHYRLASQSG
jgi:hypothetical protein